MENRHPGYRELSDVDFDLMSRVRTLGAEIEAVHKQISDHVDCQFRAASMSGEDGELARMYAADPKFWVREAKADFQTGLMALIRAVAQPTTF